jgi:hypothetical protein
MWYTTPEALAIIARITAKPAVILHERRFPRTTDRWYEFAGPEVDALFALYNAAFRAADHDDRLRAMVIQTNPEDVIGALWGDPNGNQYFRTDRDAGRTWQSLREQIGEAMAEHAMQVAA